MDASESLARRRAVAELPRRELARLQLERLHRLLAEILPANRLYARKLAGHPASPRSLDELADWPFTTKDDLIAAPPDPASAADSTEPFLARLAANRTYPLDRYVRCHRTSGTRGEPLVVVDTADDWRWWLDGWQFVLDAARIEPTDRVLLAFSFGPFIGFWSAFDAVAARGALTIPTGGLNTVARLQIIESLRATALLCTPSYALHLASAASGRSHDRAASSVRTIVVAGEPGGSTPAVRRRIGDAWNARLIDHAGATEVGPWGFGDDAGEGLFVNESQFYAEFITPGGDRPADPGDLAELVLTTLGRPGAPVIRYRTGDLVRAVRPAPDARGFLFLPGGVVGRADDMLTVRGVNLFPSSLDAVVWSFPSVREYRAAVRKRHELDELIVDVDLDPQDLAPLATELQLRLGLRVVVNRVEPGSLPHFEGKGRRLTDERPPTSPLSPPRPD